MTIIHYKNLKDSIENHGFIPVDNFPAKPSVSECESILWLMPDSAPDSPGDIVATWAEVCEWFKENDELYPDAYEYLLDNGYFWLTPVKEMKKGDE